MTAYNNSEDEQLKAFLHFVCKNEADDDFTRTLESRIRTIINSEKFRTEYLAVNLHDRDLIKEGAHDKAVETARNMLAIKKLTVSEIAQCTGLTEEEVSELKQN